MDQNFDFFYEPIQGNNIDPSNHANIQEQHFESWRAAIRCKDYKAAKCLIETLLKSGANINFPNAMGETFLHIAAQIPHGELAKLEEEKYLLVNYLIDSKADVNAQDFQKRTPLVWAVVQEDLSMVNWLHQKQANIHITTALGQNLLHLAVQSEAFPLAQYLIKLGSHINAQDYKGWTPLALAVLTQKVNIVELLCKNGADPRIANHAKGTPLHFAVQSGNSKLVSLLIDSGADIDPQDDQGWTPFYLAVSRGDTEIAELLCQNGANINLLCFAPNSLQKTNTKHFERAERYAEMSESFSTIDEYINALFPVQSTTEELTSLQYAILKRDFKMVMLVLKYGARLDIPTETHIINQAIQSLNDSNAKDFQNSIDIIALLINAGIYTGTAEADLLDGISALKARNSIKKHREKYYTALFPLFQHSMLKFEENGLQNSPLPLEIQYLLKTRFKLESWHPYLKRLCESFQAKLSQTSRTDETSEKFLQATIQFTIIEHFQQGVGEYNPRTSLKPDIPPAFKTALDKINNHSLALTRLYKTYLEPVGYPLESISSKGQTQQNILEYLEDRSLAQINEGFITQFYLVLTEYMRKALPEFDDFHPQYIRFVYDNNSSLQDELMQGWPNESQLRPSNNLRR